MGFGRPPSASPTVVAVWLVSIVLSVFPVTGAFVAYGASSKIHTTEGDDRRFYMRLFARGAISQIIWLSLLVAWLLPWVAL